MPSPEDFWEALFATDVADRHRRPLQMRVLRKRGHPFLLLPAQPQPAALSLDLYPAQTTRARSARTVLRCLFLAGLPVGANKVSVTISPEDPFVKFLSAAAGAAPGGIPCFGILAGNRATEGQRFLVLLFDNNRKPVAVVKAGLSERARALIQKEEAFLASAPAGTRGIPGLRATFQSPRLRALALDYFPGRSPRPADESGIPSLLGSWIDPERRISLADTPDWQRLEQAGLKQDWFSSVTRKLRDRTCPAVIHHGDFAPWNIRVSPHGEWTALDWERGERAGIPGWDWFHYALQPGILVRRLPCARLIQRIEELLRSQEFAQYARLTAVSGLERWLVLAYLAHCLEVIKPSEGLSVTRELLGALRARWPME